MRIGGSGPTAAFLSSFSPAHDMQAGWIDVPNVTLQNQQSCGTDAVQFLFVLASVI